MSKCRFCPRECGKDREKGAGVCGADNRIMLGRAALHYWEEPCISGTCGSGTVFFCGCTLGCAFCQNRRISKGGGVGREVSTDELFDIMEKLKGEGAHNINLVTADQYLPYILPILKRDIGIPKVLNTSSYLKESAVLALNGAIDIFLADLKFSDSRLSGKYCNAPDYPDVAKRAIDAMVRVAGKPLFENGILQRGVIVRVLVMPGAIIDAKRSIKYLHERYKESILISVMTQYTPMEGCGFPELARGLTEGECRSIARYCERLGIKGYIQQHGAEGEQYIPEFWSEKC